MAYFSIDKSNGQGTQTLTVTPLLYNSNDSKLLNTITVKTSKNITKTVSLTLSPFTFTATQTELQLSKNGITYTNVTSDYVSSGKGEDLYIKESFLTNGFGAFINESVYNNPLFNGVAIGYDGNWLTLLNNKHGDYSSSTPVFNSKYYLDRYFDTHVEGLGYAFLLPSNLFVLNKTITIITAFNGKSNQGNVSILYNVGILKIDLFNGPEDVFNGYITSGVIVTSYETPVISISDGDLYGTDFGKAMADSYAYANTGKLSTNLQPTNKRLFWKLETFPASYTANFNPSFYNKILNPLADEAGYAAMNREAATNEHGFLSSSPGYEFNVTSSGNTFAYERLLYAGYILNADNDFLEEGPWELYVSTDNLGYFTTIDIVYPGRENVVYSLENLDDLYDELKFFVYCGYIQIYTPDGNDLLFTWEASDNGAHAMAYQIRPIPCIIDGTSKVITMTSLYTS